MEDTIMEDVMTWVKAKRNEIDIWTWRIREKIAEELDARRLTFPFPSIRWTNLVMLVIIGLGFWGISMGYFAEYEIRDEGLWRFVLHILAEIDMGGRGEEPGRFAFLLREIGPELIGIAITVGVIDALNERRQKQLQRARLVMELHSRNQEVVESAIRILKTLGKNPPHNSWLNDGTLKGVKLDMCNLSGLELNRANLKRARLFYTILNEAKLQEANLEGANLEGARLEEAELFKANLRRTHLQNTCLNKADLVGADLRGAYLSSTDLTGANLSGANLIGVKYLTASQLKSVGVLDGARMPDGTELHATASSDMLARLGKFKECYLKNPTLEEWLERQKQLSSKRRAITLEEPVSSMEPVPSDTEVLHNMDVKHIRWEVRNVAKKRGVHVNKVYAQLRREFGVKRIEELTRAQYNDVIPFLVKLRNHTD